MGWTLTCLKQVKSRLNHTFCVSWPKRLILGVGESWSPPSIWLLPSKPGTRNMSLIRDYCLHYPNHYHEHSTFKYFLQDCIGINNRNTRIVQPRASPPSKIWFSFNNKSTNIFNKCKLKENKRKEHVTFVFSTGFTLNHARTRCIFDQRRIQWQLLVLDTNLGYVLCIPLLHWKNLCYQLQLLTGNISATLVPELLKANRHINFNLKKLVWNHKLKCTTGNEKWDITDLTNLEDNYNIIL